VCGVLHKTEQAANTIYSIINSRAALRWPIQGSKAIKTTVKTEQSVCSASRSSRGSNIDSAKQQHKLQCSLLLINQGH